MKKYSKTRKAARTLRHGRITRKLKLNGNELPRLVVTKTNANIIAQIFDDAKGVTLVSSSSIQLKLKSGNVKACEKVGEDIAKKALAKNIKKVSFDRGGSKYHGRVQALADAARKAGLEF
ncbi:MAG: 50S ribosomal protein L18 [Mycoplasmoidaceae bacterium]|nr:50S ribosomal protein L18 [Mycoplasmoidaceae bacterium]